MHRFADTCTRDARRLPSPVDYFRGTRRAAEELPDNVLCFRRDSFGELNVHPGGSSFHERWVLLVALAGKGAIRLDERAHALRPGQAFLVPPLRLHGYPRADARLCWLFVTFEWPGHSPSGEAWPRPRPLGERGSLLVRRLLAERLAPRGSAGVQAALLLDLLVHLRRPGGTGAPGPAGGSLIEAVRRTADSVPPPRVDEVARRLGIAASHLRARFLAEAGVSLGRYLREARIRSAALALRERGIAVKEAAELAGYADPFTFSKAFRRVIGQAPSEVALRKPGPR